MGKKAKSEKNAAQNPILAEADKVTFPVWFSQQVKAGRLNFWQEREVSVFFREKGLSDREEADKYSELLKLY
jgi:hypothetical protein